METNTLETQHGNKRSKEPIFSSLTAYYFYLILGICVPFLFLFLGIFLITFYNDFFNWYNAPKYYDSDYPIQYFYSIIPDMVITMSVFFVLTFSIGHLTTCFFSKKTSCINWKKLTTNGYSHGLLFVIFISLSFTLSVGMNGNASAIGIVKSFEFILFALLASLSPLLLLYLNRSIGKKTYGSQRVNRAVLYTVFTLVTILSVFCFYFVIDFPISVRFIDPFGVQSLNVIWIIYSSIILPFTVYLTTRLATTIAYSLSSSADGMKKRNLPIIFLSVYAICYLVFNPFGALIKTLFLCSIPILLLPLAIHHLSNKSNKPMIRKIFSLY